MKQLKALLLVSCLSFVINCKTAPPLQSQENEQDQAFLIDTRSKSSTINAEGVDINKGQTTYINMNEETFMNLLNAQPDTLSLIEGIWSNDKNTYKIGIQKAEEKGKYVAFILSSQEPSVEKGEILAEFFETGYEYIYSTEYYLEDKTKIVTKTYIDEQGMLLIFLHEGENESIAFFRSFPIKDATEEKEKASELKQSFAKEDETGTDEYYVHVSVLKNNNDAQKLLVKIKIYYPDAYIVVNNNFRAIRIPGILTMKQGANVSKDIEKKFNLKPILVIKK